MKITEFRKLIRKEIKAVIKENLSKKSQLNEEETFDFTNPEQYQKFIGVKNDLVGKKIKLNIFDTSADRDTEKENYKGDIIVDLEKRTGSTSFSIKFVATLVDAGGYKYMAPFKGKKIVIELPPIQGTNGSFNSEDYDIDGTFKVKTLTIL